MADLQFPPSSPVLNAADLESDPFARPKDTIRGRAEYPTPNPSSTAGRSSSPARYENELDDEKLDEILGEKAPVLVEKHALDRQSHAPEIRPTVCINRDFNILNPDASVLRVPLVSGKSQLLVGRSSKSCDFHIRTKDKTVSRSHVKIEYTAIDLIITCLGYNGFGMIVPRVCQVSKAENGEFELRETGKPLHAPNLSRTIHLDYQHTEFYVNRGEVVRMPRFANVLLQIREQVLLVNPDDYEEELTDDETIELAQKTQNEPKINVAAPQTTQTPTTQMVFVPKTPQKHAPKILPEEPTPSKLPLKEVTFKIFEDAQQPRAQPPKRSLTPLSNKSTNLPMTPPAKRRAHSEEPGIVKKPKQEGERVKQEPARDAEGKLIIDELVIDGISNLGEIRNILINHLAFSRLSSTPASFLNTISAAVAKLDIAQLRSVLHSVECIGVIYREGKDAAGKMLEEEYYYVPEKDFDMERTLLVALIKGHGGLRACRKTHKQYYWKKPAPIKK